MGYQGSLYLLLVGYSARTECRVARVDAAGEVIWVRDVAAGPNLGCVGIASDATGLYVAVNAVGRLDGVRGDDGWDAYVRKIDAHGSTIWTRSYSTPDSETSRSIAAGGGGVVLGGVTKDEVDGDAFMRRYDTAGRLQWTRFMNAGREQIVTDVAAGTSGVFASVLDPEQDRTLVTRFGLDGGSGWTSPVGTRTEPGGLALAGDRLLVAGMADDPRAVEPAARTGFVASVDAATGERIWFRQVGGVDSGVVVTAVAAGPAGVYVGGGTTGALPRFENLGHRDAFVRAYDMNGHRRWTRQFGTHRTDDLQDLEADAGGVTTVGTTTGNLGDAHVVGLATFARRWQPA